MAADAEAGVGTVAGPLRLHTLVTEDTQLTVECLLYHGESFYRLSGSACRLARDEDWDSRNQADTVTMIIV